MLIRLKGTIGTSRAISRTVAPPRWIGSLGALEALLAGQAVEQRPRRVLPDVVGEDAGEHPGADHQGQPPAEPVDVAGGGIEDLGRVPDDHVDQRQSDHQEHPGRVEASQVLADGAAYPR